LRFDHDKLIQARISDIPHPMGLEELV
jgi:hypothetical protein